MALRGGLSETVQRALTWGWAMIRDILNLAARLAEKSRNKGGIGPISPVPWKMLSTDF